MSGSAAAGGRVVASRHTFLPDFCSLEAVFPVVVIGQLLAFVLVLRPGGGMADVWFDLALTSLFIQWVGLTVVAVLCMLRGVLLRLPPVYAGIGAYVTLVVVVAALSEAAYQAGAYGYLGRDPAPATILSDTVFWLTQQPALGLDLASARHADFLIRTTVIGAIVGAVALRYMHVQFQWKRNLESEAQARIEALQARIRPHFLFNSMNTIASFARSDPGLAEQVVEDLSDLLRASLADAAAGATLASELELARGYLRIETLRLGPRLQVDWQVDDLPEDAALPSLTLQPLVENAVYHGIEPLDGGGVIAVAGWRDDAGLHLRIRNPLPPGGSPREGNRIAQRNVAERLRHHHGASARLQVDSDGGHYAVTLHWPYQPRVAVAPA